jgi:uncharacterized membrane-anchored protein
MTTDTLIALAIVAGAVAYLVRRAVLQSRARKAQGPSCDNCAH